MLIPFKSLYTNNHVKINIIRGPLLARLYKQEIRFVIKIGVFGILFHEFIIRIWFDCFKDPEAVIGKCIDYGREHPVIYLDAFNKPCMIIASFHTIIRNVHMEFFAVLIAGPELSCPQDQA